MVDCRDKARLANKTIRDLKRHVARGMNSKMPLQHRSNFVSEDGDGIKGYKEELYDDSNVDPVNTPVF